MRQTAFRTSCMNQASDFKWRKRFKEGREFVRDDGWCGRSKEVSTPDLIGQRVRVRVEVLREIRKRFRWKRPALFKSGQWHFHQDNKPVHNSILVTDYLTKMGIKTVPQPLYSRDLAPCNFWLFPKLMGCRNEAIEDMKEAVKRSLTRSHKRTSMGHSRSCWNGTSAYQPEEITSKGTRVSCVYYQ